MHQLLNFTKTVFLSSLLVGAVTTAQAQTCTQTASGSNINVANGQVVCVTSDLTANVDIAGGGILKVEYGATLNIQNFNTFSGTLINNGTVIAGNINYGSGAVFTNYNVATINGNQNYNGTATVNNKPLATFTVNGTFSLGNSSTINNEGSYISTSGDVSFNSGTLNNSGRFEVRSGNFNPSGTVVNNGFFKVNNFINFNGGNVTNNCRFVVGNGFNVNNTTFINDGLVWVTNTTSGKIQHNSGTWMNTARGKVRGHDFINGATVSGGGEFYFTGDTRQQGTFAGSYNSTDSAIKFFDNSYSPNITGSVFDFGIQGINVIRPVAILTPDTLSFGGTCSQQTFNLIPVPLALNLIRFNAAVSGSDVLLSWETSNESDAKEFIVEYSRNGTTWERIGAVAANGSATFNSYQFTHFNVSGILNLYRLKMTDIDGKYNYSPVKSVAINKDIEGGELHVYPNPFKENVGLEYMNSDQQDFVKIYITDVTGKLLLVSDWKLSKGMNSNTVNLKKLPAGMYFLTLRNNINGAAMLQRKILKD